MARNKTVAHARAWAYVFGVLRCKFELLCLAQRCQYVFRACTKLMTLVCSGHVQYVDLGALLKS
eukprot:6245767-Alexandrium_andersonii.AAC.1